MSPEEWDDSAILKAFEAAVASHSAGEVSATAVSNKGSTGEDAHEESYEKKGSTTASPPSQANQSKRSETGSVPHFPLPPVDDDEELSKLLMSWYYAGYQMGRYEALRRLH